MSDVPFMISDRGVPPLAVLNGLLPRGRLELGGYYGGAEWEPFMVDETEYRQTVENLVRGNAGGMYECPPPPEVTNFDSWREWAPASAPA